MTARPSALPLAALAALAIVVAACGPAGTATQAPGGTQGPATQAPATQAPATQGPASTDGALPSFDLSSFHADADLEDLFPDEIGGEEMTVLSMSGADFLGEGASPELDATLSALNKQPSDLSVAFGGAGMITIIAFQIDGVPANTIRDALFQAYEAETEATSSNVSIGGKSVTKFTPADSSEDPTYIHATQDVIFVVGGSDITDALLNEVFSKLP
jgi:hypothetical protein